ncbi:MAG: type II toxin-antitoxin system VapC family toxin [Thermoplasmatota archaeon]
MTNAEGTGTLSCIVLDASVLAKTVLVEPESESVIDAMSRAATAGVQLRTPSLARYEVGNAILQVSRRSMESMDVEAGIAHALALVEESYPRGSVSAWARKYDLTFYDAAYLAMAKESSDGARLCTFDKKLGAAAQAEGIRISASEILVALAAQRESA